MRNKFPYRLNRPNIRISAELPICGAEFLKNVKRNERRNDNNSAAFVG